MHFLQFQQYINTSMNAPASYDYSIRVSGPTPLRYCSCIRSCYYKLLHCTVRAFFCACCATKPLIIILILHLQVYMSLVQIGF